MTTQTKHNMFWIAMLIIACIACLLIFVFSVHASEKQAWDTVHVTGSTLGTLYIQYVFHLPYLPSALLMLSLGMVWEILDALNGSYHFNDRIFDDHFDIKDLLRDGIGITIAFPIRLKR